MKTAIATIRGKSPYSQSRQYSHEVPKLSKELPDAYEERTWRNRLHVVTSGPNKGRVFIPGTSFANGIKEACKRLKLQVPGKGRVEYTKYFEAGVMCLDGLVLDVSADDATLERLYVPSDGRPGGGKRVWKNFPRIDDWGGDVAFQITDDLITPQVFEQVLVAFGEVVGIGRFRPQNRGYYGRFDVEKIVWREGLSLSNAHAA